MLRDVLRELGRVGAFDAREERVALIDDRRRHHIPRSVSPIQFNTQPNAQNPLGVTGTHPKNDERRHARDLEALRDVRDVLVVRLDVQHEQARVPRRELPHHRVHLRARLRPPRPEVQQRDARQVRGEQRLQVRRRAHLVLVGRRGLGGRGHR